MQAQVIQDDETLLNCQAQIYALLLTLGWIDASGEVVDGRLIAWAISALERSGYPNDRNQIDSLLANDRIWYTLRTLLPDEALFALRRCLYAEIDRLPIQDVLGGVMDGLEARAGLFWRRCLKVGDVVVYCGHEREVCKIKNGMAMLQGFSVPVAIEDLEQPGGELRQVLGVG